MMKTRRFLSDKTGFTLLELVVVVMILGLMFGTAIPIFSDTLRKKRAEGYVEEIASTFRLANQKSVFQQQDNDVVVDFTRQRFWIESMLPGKHSKKLKLRAEESQKLDGAYEFILVYFPGSGESETRRKVRIPFNPDGTAKEAIVFLGQPMPGGREYAALYAIEIRGVDARVRILPEQERQEYEHLL